MNIEYVTLGENVIELFINILLNSIELLSWGLFMQNVSGIYATINKYYYYRSTLYAQNMENMQN